MSALGDKDVARLNVAVDDTSRMSRIQGVGISMAKKTTSSVSNGRPAILCFNVSPSRYSIAMKGWPSCSPISYMVQMLGWFNADAA